MIEKVVQKAGDSLPIIIISETAVEIIRDNEFCKFNEKLMGINFSMKKSFMHDKFFQQLSESTFKLLQEIDRKSRQNPDSTIIKSLKQIGEMINSKEESKIIIDSFKKEL